MSELVKANVSGLSAIEPVAAPNTSTSRGVLHRIIDRGAEYELFYQATGKTRVYDPNDPSVEKEFQNVVWRTLARREFTDPKGERHSIPIWDDQVKQKLATDFLKRTIPELQKKAPL